MRRATAVVSATDVRWSSARSERFRPVWRGSASTPLRTVRRQYDRQFLTVPMAKAIAASVIGAHEPRGCDPANRRLKRRWRRDAPLITGSPGRTVRRLFEVFPPAAGQQADCEAPGELKNYSGQLGWVGWRGEAPAQRRRTQGPREVSAEQSPSARHPILAAEWDRGRNHGLDLAAINPKSTHKVWWRCGTCDHEWKAAVASRTYAGTGCPACGLRRRARTQSKVDPARSLAVKHAGIAAQLHPSRNQAIDPASSARDPA